MLLPHHQALEPPEKSPSRGAAGQCQRRVLKQPAVSCATLTCAQHCATTTRHCGLHDPANGYRCRPCCTAIGDWEGRRSRDPASGRKGERKSIGGGMCAPMLGKEFPRRLDRLPNQDSITATTSPDGDIEI